MWASGVGAGGVIQHYRPLRLKSMSPLYDLALALSFKDLCNIPILRRISEMCSQPEVVADAPLIRKTELVEIEFPGQDGV
jgi:hypothetical protein